MNNKGFTLVELLAVVAILSVVGGIAIMGVLGTINKSKIKAEEIFKNKIAQSIEISISNLPLEGNKINGTVLTTTGSSIKFNKCYEYKDGSCKNEKESSAIQVTKSGGIKLSDIINSTNIFTSNKVVNPSTKKEISNLNSINVYLFKDIEGVYYYYLDLNQQASYKNIEYAENGIVENIPDSLCSKITSICK